MLKAWILLMLTIVCEAFGVSVTNYSQEGNRIFVYSFMFVMVGVACYSMSLPIHTISVGVAYAIWEIAGFSLIALATVFISDTSLKMQEYIGLALAIVGIVLVDLGEKHEDEKGVENV